MLKAELHDNTSATLKRLIQQGQNLTPILQGIGATLEQSTKRRFWDTKTDPTGKKWQPLSPLTELIKRTQGQRHGILIGQGSLAGGIQWQLHGNSVVIGATDEYARVQQFGAVIKPRRAKRLAFNGYFAKQVKIPARPFLGVSKDDQEAIFQLVKKRLLSQVG